MFEDASSGVFSFLESLAPALSPLPNGPLALALALAMLPPWLPALFFTADVVRALAGGSLRVSETTRLNSHSSDSSFASLYLL